MKKNKYLVIQGELWPNHIFFKIFECLNSKFISFYSPIENNSPISKNKIFSFNEKSKNKLLWPIKLIMRSFKLYKILKIEKIDYVITHHDDANISILFLLLFSKILKKKIKFYAYIHNGNFEKKDLFSNFIKFNIKYFYKYFDKIITVSYGNKIYLEKKFKLKNIEVIYNPIEINNYLKLSNDNLEKNYLNSFENDQFKFIFIGRLSFEKNLFNLLEVFSKLKNLNFKLYIIGEGKLKKNLEKKIKDLDLNDKIILLGFQKNVFKFIKKSDCFILNSYWESFGQVLVESLILNKIIISTDCGGPREILCPELKLNEKVEYPYYGQFGILNKPYNLNNDDLSSNLILEKLLKKIIKNKKKYIKKYNKGIERAKYFDKNNISKIMVEKLK